MANVLINDDLWRDERVRRGERMAPLHLIRLVCRCSARMLGSEFADVELREAFANHEEIAAPLRSAGLLTRTDNGWRIERQGELWDFERPEAEA